MQERQDENDRDMSPDDETGTAWVTLVHCHSDSAFSFAQMILETEEIGLYRQG